MSTGKDSQLLSVHIFVQTYCTSVIVVALFEFGGGDLFEVFGGETMSPALSAIPHTLHDHE